MCSDLNKYDGHLYFGIQRSIVYIHYKYGFSIIKVKSHSRRDRQGMNWPRHCPRWMPKD